MPPKKDDKKGKKSASVKEVDLTEYIRPSTEIETSLLDEAPKPTLSGKIANVETLFPEWIDIESEVLFFVEKVLLCTNIFISNFEGMVSTDSQGEFGGYCIP